MFAGPAVETAPFSAGMRVVILVDWGYLMTRTGTAGGLGQFVELVQLGLEQRPVGETGLVLRNESRR